MTDFLTAKMDQIRRSTLDQAHVMLGFEPFTDAEWAEYNRPENVEARRIESERREAAKAADRLANPDKYTCPTCKRDYDE